MVGCGDVQILSATLPHTRESTAGSCMSCRVWWLGSQASPYLNTPNPYQWVDKEHGEAGQSSASPGFLHSHPQMTFLCPHLCSSGLCHLSCSAGGVKTSPSYSTTRSHPFKPSPYTTTSRLQTRDLGAKNMSKSLQGGTDKSASEWQNKESSIAFLASGSSKHIHPTFLVLLFCHDSHGHGRSGGNLTAGR